MAPCRFLSGVVIPAPVLGARIPPQSHPVSPLNFLS